MTSPNLPAAVTARLAARLDGAAREPLKAAQARMSALYRDGGHSRVAVPDAMAATAYAVARMPATYAACVRAFDLVAAQAPQFMPRGVLDLGSGTGSATLAARAVWTGLQAAHLIEPHAALAAIAADLMAGEAGLATAQTAGDVLRSDASFQSADVVTLSYVLAEQALPQIEHVITRAAKAAAGVLVVIEPGTPEGYARVLAARHAMISAGLSILAPCPHEGPCPLKGDDWCHFSVRLQRSAGHMALKDADVPFEDERFAFVAGARASVGVAAPSRLIRPPQIEKGFVDLTLCAADGVEQRRVMRRDKAAYKQAKGLGWGDGV